MEICLERCSNAVCRSIRLDPARQGWRWAFSASAQTHEKKLLRAAKTTTWVWSRTCCRKDSGSRSRASLSKRVAAARPSIARASCAARLGSRANRRAADSMLSAAVPMRLIQAWCSGGSCGACPRAYVTGCEALTNNCGEARSHLHTECTAMENSTSGVCNVGANVKTSRLIHAPRECALSPAAMRLGWDHGYAQS